MAFDRHSKIAFGIVCVLLIGSRFGFSTAQRLMGAYLNKEPVPLRLELSRIPRRIGEWEARRPDQLVDEAQLETLGTKMYLMRIYESVEDIHPRIQVHLAYYTGLIDPVPHVPDRCFVAGGLNAKALPRNYPLQLNQGDWLVHDDRVNRATDESYRTDVVKHPFTGEAIEVTMPVGEFQMRTTSFEDPRQPGRSIVAGYFFIANGRVTPTPEGVRLMAFDLSEKYAYYCKVQLTVNASADFQLQHFDDLSTVFLDDFLPELMRCLPDWWALESSEAPKPPTK